MADRCRYGTQGIAAADDDAECTVPRGHTGHPRFGNVDSANVDSASVDSAEADKTEPIGEPLAFVDTATGETIIVRFVRPLRPDRLIGPR